MEDPELVSPWMVDVVVLLAPGEQDIGAAWWKYVVLCGMIVYVVYSRILTHSMHDA